MPLPSATLKIGKLLRDPKILAPQAANPHQACAYMIAGSYAYVPSGYPILGPFIEVMAREPYKGKITSKEHLTESYQKPQRPGGAIDLYIEDAECQIMRRYDITLDEIEEVHTLIRSIETLPVYIEHPVFAKLLQVDYS